MKSDTHKLRTSAEPQQSGTHRFEQHQEGCRQRLGGQRPRELPLVHLRPGRGLGLSHRFLSGRKPDRRADRLARNIRSGIRCPPDRCIVLGQWGDKHGRKNVLGPAMLLMGVSTFAVGPAAHLRPGPHPGPGPAAGPSPRPGIRGGRRAQRGQRHDLVEHAPFGRRGFYASFALQGTQAWHTIAAAVFLPLLGRAVRGGLPRLGAGASRSSLAPWWCSPAT